MLAWTPCSHCFSCYKKSSAITASTTATNKPSLATYKRSSPSISQAPYTSSSTGIFFCAISIPSFASCAISFKTVARPPLVGSLESKTCFSFLSSSTTIEKSLNVLSAILCSVAEIIFDLAGDSQSFLQQATKFNLLGSGLSRLGLWIKWISIFIFRYPF